ncbi:MAG: hypothetical protein P8Y21_03775 [Gemmatimonadales bacterium]|jgi:hypothetical protein
MTGRKLGRVLFAAVLVACSSPDTDNGAGTGGEVPLGDRSPESATEAAADARQILDGAARAMGGEAVANVQTVAIRADVQGPESSFETVLYSARDGRVRMMQTTGLHVGLSPSGDWILPSVEKGRQPLPPEIREVVIGHELHMIFIDPQSRYSDPAALEPSFFRGRQVLTVRVRGDEGRSVLLYYDVRDTLPVGMLLETAVGEVDVEVADWELLEDLKLFRSAAFRDRSGTFEYAYRDIRVNETTDDEFLPEGGETKER